MTRNELAKIVTQVALDDSISPEEAEMLSSNDFTPQLDKLLRSIFLAGRLAGATAILTRLKEADHV